MNSPAPSLFQSSFPFGKKKKLFQLFLFFFLPPLFDFLFYIFSPFLFHIWNFSFILFRSSFLVVFVFSCSRFFAYSSSLSFFYYSTLFLTLDFSGVAKLCPPAEQQLFAQLYSRPALRLCRTYLFKRVPITKLENVLS